MITPNEAARSRWASYRNSNGVERALVFHECMGLPIGDDVRLAPPVSQRILRGKLLIEEVFETLKAMGLTLGIREGADIFDESNVMDLLVIEHVEGSRYDAVETADGLADIKVICNGTAAAFAIPLTEVADEVFFSNMAKLDEEGNPIVNHCNDCRDDIAHPLEQCGLTDKEKPHGKLLKPAGWQAPDIAGVLARYPTPFRLAE